MSPISICKTQARWRLPEFAFWAATLLPFLLFSNHLVLASQIAITGLFALSLDLILGYAGIVSLGHAAFFGLGAYAAGIISNNGLTEPLVGLLVGPAVAGIAGYASSFIPARFRHLTLIMITMGLGFLLHEAANSAEWLALQAAPTACRGCASGRCSACFASTSTAIRLMPTRSRCCSWSSWRRDG